MKKTNDEMILEAKSSVPDANGQLTLASWLETWLEVYKTPGVSYGTVKMYKHLIRLVMTSPTAYMPLKDITEPDIQKMFNAFSQRGANTHSGRPYSKSIFHKLYDTLNQAFRKAKRLGYISSNPCDEIILPQANENKVLPLTHREQEDLERACEVHPLGHLIIFLLNTGLRASEMYNLCWEDYNSREKEIYIRKSKTAAGVRTVPLLEKAHKIILQQPKNSNYIFTLPNGGRITYDILRNTCMEVKKSAGLRYFTSHVCRHTFVTRLCEKGVSAQAIAQIIGHSDYSYVLSIYAWLEKEQLKKAIYVLE
ncbi:MAG: tyrosine-type recombinase/integrase [Acutalibacteraceae bacterium]